MQAKGSEHKRQRLLAETPDPHVMALRGRGVAKSRLGGTVTEDKLTSTSAVVIAIITVRAMLSIVACLELGIKTVSYSALVCGSVVMMFAFALDEPWYILNLIVRTVGHHLNHFIAIATSQPLPTRHWERSDGKTASAPIAWARSSALSWHASLADAPSSTGSCAPCPSCMLCCGSASSVQLASA